MTNRGVTGSSIVVATEDQVSSGLGGEVAILSLRHGVYYGLDAVGARFWALVQEPRSINEIKQILLEEYEVGSDVLEHDLFALVQRLASEGLVEVKHETSS